MKAIKENFIIDEKGHRKAVVLDIGFYNQLLEDLEDLRVISERKSEPTVSLKEVEKHLKKNGLI